MSPRKTPRAKVCVACGQHRSGGEYATSRARRCIACVERVPERKCHRCGEQRATTMFVKRGYVCSACRQAERPTSRQCWTCDSVRPIDDFDGPFGRRCAACRTKVQKKSRCVVCGDPAPLTQKGNPRSTCARKECVDTIRAENARKGREAMRQKIASRTSKRCPSCLEQKPLTREHWAVRRLNLAGEPVDYDSYCLPCRAAYNADRYHSDPRHRQYMLAKAKRARERENKRRREDPAFDQVVRARRLEWERARRERRRHGAPAEVDVRRRDASTFPQLPALPLHQALMRLAGTTLIDNPILHVSAAAGIADRQLRAWGPNGTHELVQFDVADRVLTRLGLLWFDVWEPGTPEGDIAEAAFEGESAVAA